MKCIDPDCRHYVCQSCGHDVCPDRHVSPGEPNQCAACHDLEAALTQALVDEPAGPYSWNGNAA